MKTLTIQENLQPSENHRGWAVIIDGVRVGEIYPQDSDGNEGAKAVAAIGRAFAHAAKVEDLLVTLANKVFGAGHGEPSEDDRLAIIAALDTPCLTMPREVRHNGKSLTTLNA